MKLLERQDYLNWLIKWKDTQIIKVISGIRRCGKSTMFKMYQDYLLKNGVAPEQIISINFEDLEFEDLNDYRALYAYVKERLIENRNLYIFLDEIQHVAHYEKAVDSLFLKEQCDIYITGSSSYFMSGELATLFTGRYIELTMVPLSFREYCTGLDANKQNNLSLTEKLDLYISCGAFPYVLKYGYDPQEAKEYMNNIYNTILLNDIAKRLDIEDVDMIDTISTLMMHNIGDPLSPSKIANTMTANYGEIEEETVKACIRGLTESQLFYKVNRYNIKGKMVLTSINKFYICDIGLLQMKVSGKDNDIWHSLGHIKESILGNFVYLELRRRYTEIYVGEIGTGGKIDFVAVSDGIPTYFQVAHTVHDPKVLQKKLAPLTKIGDDHLKYILTLDAPSGEMDYDGIKRCNVLEWMLAQ